MQKRLDAVSHVQDMAHGMSMLHCYAQELTPHNHLLNSGPHHCEVAPIQRPYKAAAKALNPAETNQADSYAITP